jgi:hypothetical protein
MSLVEKRKSVYENLEGYNEASFPGLVYFYDADLQALRSSIARYLEKTLESFYEETFSILSDDDLEKYAPDILNLPNVTPNGTILPKKETGSFLNEAQVAFMKVLDSLKITDQIEKMTCVHVMIKTPHERKIVQNRPYYTGKTHSDAWIGHPGDAQFQVGVLGDIERTTVEYFEPVNPSKDFLSYSSNFDEASKRYSGKNYIGKMEESKLIVVDHVCLHRTKFESNSKTRVSINVGVTMKSDFSSENNVEILNRFEETYFTAEKLKRVGQDLTFFVEETLEQCSRKFKNTSISGTSLPNNGIVLRNRNV